MRNSSWTQSAALLLVCTAGLFVTAAACYHPRPSTPTARSGRYSQAEIIAHSVPLMQALVPTANAAETVACSTTTYDTTGRRIDHWNVDFADPATGDTAHLLWNADTGELLRASRFRPRDRFGAYDQPTSKSAAVNLAWDWFHTLKIDRPREDWRLVGAQRKPYAQWDLYFRAGARFAIVTVCTDSGQMVQTMSGRLPDATTAWTPTPSGSVS